MKESLCYKIKKKIMHFFSDIRIFPYPFFTILYGDISYQVKGPYMRKILDEIQPGDILLRNYKSYLGSLFIPGYWTHAAHFEGPNNVIHMLGKGIVVEDILTFMRCDDIAILRSKKGIASIQFAIEEARIQVEKGAEYDFDFNTNNSKRFYCTELISYIHNLNYPTDKIIMPDQFLKHDDLKIIIPGQKISSNM